MPCLPFDPTSDKQVTMRIMILRQFPALIIGALACVHPVCAAAVVDLSSPAGHWQPIDDSTGKPLGLIRIYEDKGAFFGRIEPSSLADDTSRLCSKCTGERHNQPIIGLLLMRNMRLQGNEYSGGDILYPDTGGIFGCRFRLIDGGRKLIMRGYIGVALFGRSQTWQRVD
jgi:uncharacterized protein (DUF2147 family)